MSQIDYNDAVIRALVELTCGPLFVRENVPAVAGVRDAIDQCEDMAVALGGALGHYCGCSCGNSLHPEDPVCEATVEPEIRVTRLPRIFSELGEELRQILTSTDPEMADFSFVYRFGYCPQEVPGAFDQLLTAHTVLEPEDPYSCTPEIQVDEDLFNRPAGMWLAAGAGIGVLSDDKIPLRAELSLEGAAPNGFYGGAGGTFAMLPLDDSFGDINNAYGAGAFGYAGFHAVFSESAGLRLYGGFEVGGHWAGDAFSVFHTRAGVGAKLLMWFLEGLSVTMGLEYWGTVTDTPISAHLLLVTCDFNFRLMQY